MKTGRPKQQLNKDIVKHVRYTSEEWAQVESKAEQSGMTTSEFIREATFNAEIISVQKLSPAQLEAAKELRRTRTELVRIGNNINTIARHAGYMTKQEEFDFFLKDLQNCRDIAKALSSELNKVKDAIR